MPLDTPGWSFLMEKDADQVTVQPKVQAKEEIGAHRDGVIVLSIDPSRGHLQYALPLPVDPTEIGEFESAPTLGPFLDALEWFQPLVLKWLLSLPSLARIALAPDLLWTADNREIAYEFLDEMLPDVRVDPASKDLTYRINRPRILNLGTKKLEINRISKWTADQFAYDFESASRRTENRIFHVVRAELDINTTAEHRETISHDHIRKIIDKFAHFAIEIAERGDVS